MKRIVFILVLMILIGCTAQIKEPVKEQQKAETPVVAEQINNAEQLPVAEEVKAPENPSITICNKLPLTERLSLGEKWFCLAVVNDDPKICGNIEADPGDEEDQANKDICFAVASADTSYCKKIQNLAQKHVCYYQTAVISNNINICDEIDYDKNERLQCYFTFVSNLHWWDRSNDIKEEYCNKFPTNEADKNTCLAFKNRDVSLCKNNINCLTFFKQEMSFCSGAGSELKDCIRDRAMTNKDVSICETLNGEKRDDCLGDFCTHIDLDITICDKISDDMERQSRYSEIAINTANNVRND